MRRSAWLAMLAWVLQNCHSTVMRGRPGRAGWGRNIVIAVGSVLRWRDSQPCWLAHGPLTASMVDTGNAQLPDLLATWVRQSQQCTFRNSGWVHKYEWEWFLFLHNFTV